MNSSNDLPPLLNTADQNRPPVDYLALAVSAEPTLPPSPPAGRPVSLKIAVWIAGIVQIILGWSVSGFGLGADNFPYRLGAVLGPTAILPLIIIGLFSIFPRFRSSSTRAVILLVVWGFAIFGHIGNLSMQRQRAATPRTQLRKPELNLPPIEPITVQKLTWSTQPTPPKPAAALAPAAYDFSPGSDQRLIKLIEQSQEERYHAVVVAYVSTCADRPSDAVLALERVNFVQRFAYSEDSSIDSASDDLKAAVDYLTGRFPTAPGTVLYQMGNAAGDEFDALVDKHRQLIADWPAADRASFLLMQANAANAAGTKALAQTFAARSFEADPTVAAGLLLAKAEREANNAAEGLRILTHAVFDTAEPWVKKQKMDLLFDLKEAERAVGLYAEIKAATPFLVGDTETAMRFARAGKVGEARAILAEIKSNNWNQGSLNRTRFQFELEYGNAEQAQKSYRALRALGLQTDPLLRDRAALFFRHGWLGWNLDDCVGALLLGVSALVVLLAPLIVFAPVHYWSLLRARKGKAGSWPCAFWGLRQAWAAVGILALAEVAAIWILQPEVMRSWWGDLEQGATDAPRAMLPVMTIVWMVMGLGLAALLARAKAWRLLGAGQWPLGKAIGTGLGLALLLRLGIGIYAALWPEAVANELAAVSPEVRVLSSELLTSYGPLGLIAVLAVLVPLLEELLFRGVLLQAVAKHLPFGWANAGQAALFALVHENLLLAPFFFGFGLLAGVLARRSGGLLPALVMHACNNFIVCLGLIFLQRLKH